MWGGVRDKECSCEINILANEIREMHTLEFSSRIKETESFFFFLQNFKRRRRDIRSQNIQGVEEINNSLYRVFVNTWVFLFYLLSLAIKFVEYFNTVIFFFFFSVNRVFFTKTLTLMNKINSKQKVHTRLLMQENRRKILYDEK